MPFIPITQPTQKTAPKATSDKTQSSALPVKSESTPGFLGTAARFTGVEKLGIGAGRTVANILGIGKELEQTSQQSATDLNTLIDIYRKETDPARKARLAQMIQNSPDYAANAYKDVTTGNLSNKEVLGSALQTASNFIPGAAKGASLGRKVVVGAGTGYAFDVANNLQQEKEGAAMFKPGLGTVIGGSIPLAVSATKTLAKITGLTPQQLEKSNLRLTPTQDENLRRKGSDVVEYLTDKKIVGTPEKRYQVVNDLYQNMEKKVQEIIKGSTTKFNKRDLITEIAAIPEQFADDLDQFSSVENKVDNIIDTLQKKFPEELTAEQVNSIKRAMYSGAYAKNATDVINEVNHSVGDIFRSRLDTEVEGLQRLNKEYGTLIDARKILRKAVTRNQTGIVGRVLAGTLGGTIGTAIGGTVGGGLGAVAGAGIANKVSTPLRSATGAGMKTIQDALEKIPVDKIGNLQISKKALLSLIENLR